MFDLDNDPNEMVNVYDHPNYASAKSALTKEYHRLRQEFDAPDYEATVKEKRK
jgi:N-acetylglucosamine-6-sulfatase